MRKPVKARKPLKPDLVYQSTKVTKLVNYLMEEGKKATANRVVYEAMEIAGAELDTPPLEVLELAIKNISPVMEVRSRRIGGANYQVPYEVRADRRLTLALRWLLLSARAKKGQPMNKRLAAELVAATRGEGEAVRRKDNMQKMADANRAFAHFAWASRS